MTDTEIFLTERLVRLYVADAVSKGPRDAEADEVAHSSNGEDLTVKDSRRRRRAVRCGREEAS